MITYLSSDSHHHSWSLMSTHNTMTSHKVHAACGRPRHTQHRGSPFPAISAAVSRSFLRRPTFGAWWIYVLLRGIHTVNHRPLNLATGYHITRKYNRNNFLTTTHKNQLRPIHSGPEPESSVEGSMTEIDVPGTGKIPLYGITFY